jgi:hypothetical protein
MSKRTNNPRVKKRKTPMPKPRIEEIGGWTAIRYAVSPFGLDGSEVPGKPIGKLLAVDDLPQPELPKGATIFGALAFLRRCRLERDG